MTDLVTTSLAPLSLTPIEGEHRVRDLDLGVRLGFERPLDIRELIKRNEKKLSTFSILRTVRKISEGKAGRPSVEYYLDQKQSIFICMKSETANAFDVQVEIVHVFDAHLNGGHPVAVLPQDYPAALRALADETERRALAERELEENRPKIAFHDQVIKAETLIDFPQAFSLLQGRTGQHFTRRTFLEFLRRHGIACQPNRHSNIGRDRFYPRQSYITTWFVSKISPIGTIEWLLRPLALAGIVALIEQDRMNPPPLRNALVCIPQPGGIQ